MSEKAIQLWARWKERMDSGDIKRTVGWKPSGIEYRIMVDGRAASLDDAILPNHWQNVIQDVDTAWLRINRVYPEHMEAIKVFYAEGGNHRTVRLKLGCSQHKSRVYVEEGEKYLIGGLAAIMGYNTGGE